MNRKQQDLPRKNIEQLQAEAEGARGDVAQDVEAISQKLRPSHIAGEAAEGVRSAARNAAGRVQGTAENAWNGLREGQAAEVVRQNPVPIALMTIGAGWLVANRLMASNGGGRLSAQYAGQQGKATERLDRVREEARARTGAMRQRASDARNAAIEGSRRAQTAVVERSRRARGFVEETYHQNPLAVGIFAAALGAGLGMLVPATKREDEIIGPKRDRLVGEAARTAEQVRSAAKETAEATAQEARQAAQRVAASGKEQAQSAAERHGLG